MIDTDAITRMVQQQIAETVDEQVLAVLTSDEWLKPLEQKIIQHTQDCILTRFANSDSIPEIVSAVKDSISMLFAQGQIPGIAQFVDSSVIKATIDLAVEKTIQTTVEQFSRDPLWQGQIERMINQTVVQQTMAQMSAIDIGPTIKQRVDERMALFTDSLLKNFTSTGIVDQASKCELIIMDDVVVVEQCLTANQINATDSVQVKNLVVTGSINTDNQSWHELANNISQKTLDKLTTTWTENLIEQVVEQIQEHGIDFEQISIAGQKVIEGNKLSSTVTESNLQSLGNLKNLSVRGEAKFNNDTFNILNKRVGVNTDSPEKALSVWDEEVSIVIGKHKQNQAYIGTNREQGMIIGVNREPCIEITPEGLTQIKQLQVGIHKISHSPQVPGWAGTRGDLVLNTNPGPDRVFAWVCLGSYKWQTLKSAE